MSDFALRDNVRSTRGEGVAAPCAPRLRAVAAVALACVLGACGTRAMAPGPAAAPAPGTVPAPAQAPAPVLVPVAAASAPSSGTSPSDAAVSGGATAVSPPPIPILMYHVIDVAPDHAALPGLYVAPDLFAAQVAALAAAGYQGITLQQAYDIWTGHAAAPRHPVVLSFDDGYAGVYTHAVPVLKARGWPAVLNLQVGRLNVPGGLDADQVREMIRLGWEVDDHTVTHPDLTKLPPAQLQAEIVGAAERIRREFGVPVRFFCYPAGRYDPAVVAAVRAAGFLAATTTWPGDAYPPTEGYFTLDRVRVDGGESPERLLQALARYAEHIPEAPPAEFPVPAPPAPSAPSASAAAGPKVAALSGGGARAASAGGPSASTPRSSGQGTL